MLAVRTSPPTKWPVARRHLDRGYSAEGSSAGAIRVADRHADGRTALRCAAALPRNGNPWRAHTGIVTAVTKTCVKILGSNQSNAFKEQWFSREGQPDYRWVVLPAIAAGYPTRAKFLTDQTLDPPNASSAEAGAPLRGTHIVLSGNMVVGAYIAAQL